MTDHPRITITRIVRSRLIRNRGAAPQAGSGQQANGSGSCSAAGTATQLPAIFTGGFRPVAIPIRHGQQPSPHHSKKPDMKHQASYTRRAYGGTFAP
jgi:hypothetical protein